MIMTEEEISQEQLNPEQTIILNNDAERWARINKELALIAEHYKNEDIENWKKSLELIYLDINAQIKNKKLIEEYKQLINDINKTYSNYSNQPREYSNELWSQLFKLDLKTREILNLLEKQDE